MDYFQPKNWLKKKFSIFNQPGRFNYILLIKAFLTVNAIRRQIVIIRKIMVNSIIDSERCILFNRRPKLENVTGFS